MKVKYPEITIELSGSDSNVYSIIGKTIRALRRGGATAEQINEYKQEATSGDYDHAIQTTMRWVEVS